MTTREPSGGAPLGVDAALRTAFEDDLPPDVDRRLDDKIDSFLASRRASTLGQGKHVSRRRIFVGFSSLSALAACVLVLSLGRLPGRQAATAPPESTSPPAAEGSRPGGPAAIETAPASPGHLGSGESAAAGPARYTVHVSLEEYAVLRGTTDGAGSTEQRIQLPAVQFMLVLALPRGSAAGTYTLSIVDPFGRPLSRWKAASQDGSTLPSPVDLRGHAGRRCRICISTEDGIPDCYPLVVSRRAG